MYLCLFICRTCTDTCASTASQVGDTPARWLENVCAFQVRLFEASQFHRWQRLYQPSHQLYSVILNIYDQTKISNQLTKGSHKHKFGISCNIGKAQCSQNVNVTISSKVDLALFPKCCADLIAHNLISECYFQHRLKQNKAKIIVG